MALILKRGAEVLGKIKGHDPQVQQLLELSLQSPNPNTRKAALELLESAKYLI